jgi:hypothetical protein
LDAGAGFDERFASADHGPDPGPHIRVLDETYSEEPAEYEARSTLIDPVAEIERALSLVWGERDPSTGR